MPEVSRAGIFILHALKHVGKRYRMGAEAQLTAENFANLNGFGDVNALDCSELVQISLWSAGLQVVTDSKGKETPVRSFDPSWKQWEASRSIPLTDGIKTPGALLFIQDKGYDRPRNIGHVAISLGNGYTVEARGTKYGVGIWPVRKAFNLATKVDGLYE